MWIAVCYWESSRNYFSFFYSFLPLATFFSDFHPSFTVVKCGIYYNRGNWRFWNYFGTPFFMVLSQYKVMSMDGIPLLRNYTLNCDLAPEIQINGWGDT